MTLTLHTAVFASAVVLFVAVLAFLSLLAWRKARRIDSELGVEVFLQRLVPVDRDKLATVAGDGTAVSSGTDKDSGLESWQLWELVGGLEGLQSLAANCDVLIELACYVQRWYPEALPVAEGLRCNAREIQWHLDRLRGAQARGHLQTAFPDYAQRAVTIYCGMTQHVLALYESTQVPGLPSVQAAL